MGPKTGYFRSRLNAIRQTLPYPKSLAAYLAVLAISCIGYISVLYGIFPNGQPPEHIARWCSLVLSSELVLLVGVFIGWALSQRTGNHEAQLLKECEFKYRGLYEQAAVGMGFVNAQGELLDCNQQVCTMLGYSLEELLGKTIYDITPSGDVEGHLALRQQLFAGEIQSFTLEKQYLRKDGSTFWGSTTVSLFKDEDGQPQHTIAVLNDISERKRHEAERKRAEAEQDQAEKKLQQLNQQLEVCIAQRTKALKLSEARWQFALDSVGDAVWDWDIETNDTFYSQRWKTMLGYTDGDIGNDASEWNSRVHPDDKAQCYAENNRHLRGETEVYQNEHRLRCKDGSYKWILARGKVIEWADDGQPLRMIGTHTDISDRKRLEATQKLAEQQLKTLVEATSATLGQDFFAALVQHAAQALEVPHVMVTERLGDRSRTLAFWSDGALQPEFNYHFEPTPCKWVFQKGRFYCDCDLQQQFPQAVMLEKMGAQSYLGVAMRGSDGGVIGNLCIVSRQPLANLQRAEAILKIFTARAAAELDRQRAQAALEQLNQDLETRVEARTQELQWRTRELQEQKQFLQTVLDTFPIVVFWKDRNSVYQGGNRNFLSDMGLDSVADLVGKTDYDLPLLPAEAEAYRAGDRNVMTSNIPRLNVEETQLRTVRQLRWLDTNKLPLHNLDGEVVGVLGTYQDITARKQVEIALKQSEARLRLITDSVRACISYTDSSQRYRFVNRSYEVWFNRSKQSILGCTVQEVIGLDAYRLAQPYIERALAGETVSYEMDMPYKGVEPRYVSAVLVPKANPKGQVHGYYALIHDISDFKRTQQRLIHNALHDSLTGLANRLFFTGQLEEAIARSKRIEACRYAVLFLDLDRFKVINDSLGHAIGDQLLMAIAERLSQCLQGVVGCVARLGGDEFVILLEGVADSETIVHLIERILEDVRKPFTIEGHEVFTGMSIGVTLGSSDYTQPADLIRDADIAMYQAKSQGGNRYQFFDAAMHTRMLNRLRLETDLRRAIDQRELMVYYQPIIKLVNRELVGFEALVRWHHPTRQLVSPDEFVPLAEDMGLIGALDSWTFQNACQQMSRWRQRFNSADTLRVSINLSVQDLRRASLIQDIDVVLTETGLEAHAVTLEITESLLINDIHWTIDVLSQLASRGIRISIDDFGTGYSSLSYLHHLPIHYIKIDSSFIKCMEPQNRNYQVVDTIVTLSNRLELAVIAEGIETSSQFQQLQQLGCEFGQGYLFSEALTADEIESRFLAQL